MSEINEKMAGKGKKVKLRGLLDQAPVTIQSVKDHFEKLKRFGMTEQKVAEAEALLLELSSERSLAIEARVDSKDKLGDEVFWVAAAKKHKRLLISAAADLARDDELTPAERDALNVGNGRLADSTPRIIEYLTNTKKIVNRLSNKLSPLMGESDASDQHEFVLLGLQEAQTKQETGRVALPADTLKVNELKGRLLTFIEKANSAGARAFDGNALVIGRFNKDLLLRAKSTRKIESMTEPASEAAAG